MSSDPPVFDPRPENGPGHARPGPDDRREAPATARNRAPIAAVLSDWLPPPQPASKADAANTTSRGHEGLVLDVASGTGEHCVWFSHHFPHLQWQPSDIDPEAHRSIAAWRLHGSEALGPMDFLPPVTLDAARDPWDWTPPPGPPLVAITNINMIHIAPWECCTGLMRGAGRLLPPGGVLMTYGPYKQGGQHTAESNAAFDQSLRSRNPEWGVREMEAVIAEADRFDLDHAESVPMPANNFCLLFRKR